MKVRVGTTNPVKVRATERAFLRAFPDREIIVEAVSVDSDVSPQPVGTREVHQGAKNRARKVWNLGSYSVGLEAGLIKVGDVYVDIHVAVVRDPEGREAVGTSPGFQLPPDVTEEALSGEEVGEVFSELVGVREIGKRSGAIGVLSDGKVLREDLCELAVLMALIGLETSR
ncbi:inosine/xanthosine triphosphatase [Methanopyrus sp. KOL6]|uniref:inosine/xanthosine triphosphatase n=1 Tax=Methanopyrus sp. KOL6 TaxID=1937004 RepID=UPI000B4B5028|nr:inosine/xanthosine triphosphatase [Methanopyrus sp. KOL6]